MSRNGPDDIGSRMRQRFLSVAVLLGDLVWAIAVLVALSPLVLPRRAASAVGHAYGLLALLVLAARSTRRHDQSPPRVPRGDRRTSSLACHSRGFWGSRAQHRGRDHCARRFKQGQPGWRDTYIAEDPIWSGGFSRIRGRRCASPAISDRGKSLRCWSGFAPARRVRSSFGASTTRSSTQSSTEADFGATRNGSTSGAPAGKRSRLRRGENAILGDERRGTSCVFVDFFGRPASTGKTPALLSLMTGSPVVLGAAVRRAQDDKLVVRLRRVRAGRVRRRWPGRYREDDSRVLSGPTSNG